MDSFDVTQPPLEVIDASAHVGGPLEVPASGWLMGADFAREGYDLVVSGDGGQKFIVMDYFASDTPPDLMTAENGTLRGDIVSQLAGPLNPGEYAQAAGAAEAEPIGVIETLQGVVEATRADGTKATLDLGDPIFRGDIIETGTDGSVSMVMADDSVFSLDPDGTVKMDELVYDPEDQEGSMSVSLVKGVFSFVSGQIAKTDPDAMILNTPLATVGIRGTTGVLDLPEGGSVQIVLAPDDNGETGELTIQVKDASGNPIGAPITVNVPLSAVGIAPGGDVQTFTIPAAQFQQQYGQVVAQAQQAQQNTSANNDDDDSDDGGTESEDAGEGGGEEQDAPPEIETKGASEAANDQDQSDAAEEEAEEQENAEAAEEAAAEESEGTEDSEEAEEAEEAAEEAEEAAAQLADGTATDGGEGETGTEEDEDDDDGSSEESESFNDIQLSGGNVTVPLTSANDRVWGTSGFDGVSLMGNAQSGDQVDLMGDADTLHLYPGDNVLSVANTETVTASESGGNDNVTFTTSFSGGSVNLDVGTDTVTLAGGGNTVTITNVENINGGSGTDGLTYTGGVNFVGTMFNSIESIAFGTTSGGTMSVSSGTDFGLASTPLMMIGNGNTQVIASDDGINFTCPNGVQFMNINTVNFDSDNSGVSTLSIGTLSVTGTATTFNGGSDANDIISLAGGGTYNFGSLPITNVASVTYRSAGADTLTLGSIPTSLSIDFGTGNDSLTLQNDVSAGSQSFDGGSGTDTLTLNGGASGLTPNAFVNWESWVLGSDAAYSLTLVEANIASGQTLTIDGSAVTGANTLTINGSADLDGTLNITGGAGADTLTASSNGGAINGGGGNDNLIGGAGVDNLDGGAGDDIINGGVGTDTLTGGGGADQFQFTSAATKDIVNDFTRADGDTLRIDISQYFAASVLVGTGLNVLRSFTAGAPNNTAVGTYINNLGSPANAFRTFASVAAFNAELAGLPSAPPSQAAVAFGLVVSGANAKLIAATRTMGGANNAAFTIATLNGVTGIGATEIQAADIVFF